MTEAQRELKEAWQAFKLARDALRAVLASTKRSRRDDAAEFEFNPPTMVHCEIPRIMSGGRMYCYGRIYVESQLDDQYLSDRQLRYKSMMRRQWE